MEDFGGYNIPKLGPFFRPFHGVRTGGRDCFKVSGPAGGEAVSRLADLRSGDTISRIADLAVRGYHFTAFGPSVRAITRTLNDWPSATLAVRAFVYSHF